MSEPPLKLGQRVDIVRASVGISRAKLAAALDLDRSTVTKWATGVASPRDIEAVAKELGVPVALIFATRAPAAEKSRRSKRAA